MSETFPVSGGGFIQRDLALLETISGRIAAPLTGAPVAGTNAVYTLTTGGTITSGSIEFEYQGAEASATWSSTNATFLANVNTALDTLFGAGNVQAAIGSMTNGVGTILITFAADLGLQPVTGLTIDNNLVGTNPTATISNTTPGVRPSGYNTAKGALIPTDDGLLYQNVGTATAPVLAAIPQTVVFPFASSANTTAGAALSVANPYGISVMVTGAIVQVKTPDNDETLNIGVAANGTTSSTNIFNGVEVVEVGLNQASQVMDAPVEWGDDEFITATVVGGGDGALSGFVGNLIVKILPLP